MKTFTFGVVGTLAGDIDRAAKLHGTTTTKWIRMIVVGAAEKMCRKEDARCSEAEMRGARIIPFPTERRAQ